MYRKNPLRLDAKKLADDINCDGFVIRYNLKRENTKILFS